MGNNNTLKKKFCSTYLLHINIEIENNKSCQHRCHLSALEKE